jgi:lipopolysaccharide heptosyltransferase II
MGDVLMTTPALHALRAAAPGRTLTLLTSPQAAEAAALVPDIDDVIAYDAPWLKARTLAGVPAPDHAMLLRVAAGNFDGAVIFTTFSQSALPAALFCHLAGIPLRLAYARENPYGLLTHRVIETEPEAGIRHEVERQLALVAAAGCQAAPKPRLLLSVGEAAAARAGLLLAGAGLGPARPVVAVHPGASAPSRRYPLARFAEALRLVAAAHPEVQFAITGARSEERMAQQLAALAGPDVPLTSIAGQTTVEELAAVLRGSALLLSNNSGPVHIAAAVGTPVVDLYAQTNPQHTPWGVPARVLFHPVPCANCFKSICPEGHQACLALLEPATVAAAVDELLPLRTTVSRHRPHQRRRGEPAASRSRAAL